MKQSIAELISSARKEKNISMRELARLSNISGAEVARIESGESETPKLRTLKAICRNLDIYYEECLYIMNLGGTYNIHNPVIINYYQNIDNSDIKMSYKGIKGQIEENNNQIAYMNDMLLKVNNKEDKEMLIDTIKSLEFQNITNNYIKNILEEKMINIYMNS